MSDADRRPGDLVRAVRAVASHRPAFTIAIVVMSAATALLSGVGIGFIVPIVDLAQASTPEPTGGMSGVFVAVYNAVGVPLTLETAVGGVGLVITARHALSFLTKYFRAKLRMEYVRWLRVEAAKAALTARTSFYDDRGSDEVLNAIVTQAGYAGGFITNGIDLLQAALVAAGFLAVATLLAPELTLLSVLGLGVLAVVVRVGFGSGYDAGEEVARANEAVQSAVQASTQGIRAVKLFGLTSEFISEVKSAADLEVRARVRQRRDRAAFAEFQQLASALTVFGLLYVGVTIFATPLAQLAAFLFAMFRLAPQIATVSDSFYRAEGDLPHVVRTLEFIESLEASAEPTVDREDPAELPSQIEEIVFDDVSFGYNDGSVLRGVSLTVRRPAFVALVGPSGAGKSTIVSLLSRLYDPDCGRITADGIPIDRVPIRLWRERVAVVRQQPYIFDDTLRFNLRVGNRDAPTEEIERVCDIAQVTEFLSELPDGLDTELGNDGVRLSGGQRQRVAIARALLKDADVLVLDEATSDLDTGLEAQVHDAIETMDREFAVIAVAHRLSTVVDADYIHVFEDGRVVETGTHEELVARNGPYASLYAAQATV